MSLRKIFFLVNYGRRPPVTFGLFARTEGEHNNSLARGSRPRERLGDEQIIPP